MPNRLRRKYGAIVSLVLIRQDGLCYYCEKETFIKPDKEMPHLKATLDHKTPLALKGLPFGDNVVVACKRCNDLKSCLDAETYLRLRHDDKAREAAIAETMARLNSRTPEEYSEIRRFMSENRLASYRALQESLQPVLQAYLAELSAKASPEASLLEERASLN